MSPLISCLAGTSHVIKRTRNVLPIQLVVHLEVDSTRPDPRGVPLRPDPGGVPLVMCIYLLAAHLALISDIAFDEPLSEYLK